MILGAAELKIARDENLNQNVSEILAAVMENSTQTENITIWCIARQANPQPTVQVGNLNSLLCTIVPMVFCFRLWLGTK